MGHPTPIEVKDSTYTVRELLDDFSAGWANELADQPEVEAAIRSDIGRSYWQTGRDRPRRRTSQTGPRPATGRCLAQTIERVANSLIDYAWNLGEQGRFAEAEACVREAVSIYQKLDVQSTSDEAHWPTHFISQAVAQLRQGDKAGYRDDLQALVDLPVHTDDVMANSRPVWPLCLVPDALDDMSRLGEAC